MYVDPIARSKHGLGDVMAPGKHITKYEILKSKDGKPIMAASREALTRRSSRSSSSSTEEGKSDTGAETTTADKMAELTIDDRDSESSVAAAS